MIHAGPGPLIMFFKDWVISLTAVEDRHCAMWKQTGLLTKHFLNCSQKCETWPDPGPGHGFCRGGARSSGPAPTESHTLGLKGGLLQTWSGGKFPSCQLTSCCLPLDNRPLLFPSPKNFLNSPTLFGKQCVVWTLHWRGIKGQYSHHAWSPGAWLADRTSASSAPNCWDT